MIFFYPGQGSQFVGMGKELTDKYPIAQKIFQQANDILGFDLQKICFEGDEALLTQTENAQPAILVYQYILTTLLKEQGIIPTAVAGHSLGEFSAILTSEMLDFSSVLCLVRKRGELMAASDPERKGGMAAILGMEEHTLISICQKISETLYVEPVNFNAPGQIVISGLKEGVLKVSEESLSQGAKRAIPLSVSGAFHSRLMNDAADRFAEYLESIVFQAPKYLIISNVTAEPYDNTMVKELLALQMKKPVQWIKTVEYLYSKGYDQGIEISTGSVLKGMIKKIVKEFQMESMESYLS